jgi:hypothetical protein
MTGAGGYAERTASALATDNTNWITESTPCKHLDCMKC